MVCVGTKRLSQRNQSKNSDGNSLMSNRNGDAGGFGVIIVIVSIAVAIAVWKFSRLIGVDMTTGRNVAVWLVFSILIIGAMIYFNDTLEFTPSLMIAIAICLIWFSFWPALDYWARASTVLGSLRINVDVWWAAWYTKWGVIAGIFGFWYALKKAFESR